MSVERRRTCGVPNITQMFQYALTEGSACLANVTFLAGGALNYVNDTGRITSNVVKNWIRDTSIERIKNIGKIRIWTHRTVNLGAREHARLARRRNVSALQDL